MVKHKYITVFKIVRSTDPELQEFLDKRMCALCKIFKAKSNIIRYFRDDILMVTEVDTIEHIRIHDLDSPILPTDYMTPGQARRYLSHTLLRRLFPKAACKTHEWRTVWVKCNGPPYGVQAHTILKRKQQKKSSEKWVKIPLHENIHS